MAPSGAERTIPREIEAAQDCWNESPERTPGQIPTLLAGGKAILNQPKPWDPEWSAIVKYLDGAYGSRDVWAHGTDSWEKRMNLDSYTKAELRQLEANV